MREKRDRVSLPISGEANYKIQGAINPPITVLVREISGTGLRFITTEPLANGTLLNLTIKITNAFDPMPAVGKVLWQRKISSKYLLDTCVKFVSIEADKEAKLVQYIRQFAKTFSIGRENIRCPLITDVRYNLVHNPEIENNCVSGDIGVLGIKLFVKGKLDINTNLKMAFELPDGQGLVMSLGRIVWTSQQSNEVFCVGLKFIELKEQDKERIYNYIINTTLTV